MGFDSATARANRCSRGSRFGCGRGRRWPCSGPSGSGKSTIVNLLLRFYDPEAGRITIDGVDISRVERKGVREEIAVVMQEPFLYSKTVGENIRFGRAGAPDEEVTGAAQVAAVHESIVRFEGGYGALVGERGVTLSGGQRQRVALARALLRQTPILVLDDALSAVDTDTESEIIDALRRARGRQTTIVIAHRLSTLAARRPGGRLRPRPDRATGDTCGAGAGGRPLPPPLGAPGCVGGRVRQRLAAGRRHGGLSRDRTGWSEPMSREELHEEEFKSRIDPTTVAADPGPRPSVPRMARGHGDPGRGHGRG